MKKIFTLIIALAIFSSCRNEQKQDGHASTPIQVDTLTYHFDSVKVVSSNQIKNTGSSLDSAKAVITFPVFKDQRLNAFIKRKVFDFFDEKEKATSFQDIANSFIKGYDDFFAENNDRLQSWQLLVKISVAAQHKNYVAIKYLHYDFVGGAHGNTNISYLNYDPMLHQEIVLDSLIIPSKKNELKQLAEQIFRNDEKLSPTTPLTDAYFFTEGKFSLPDRFYISEKGLVFLYIPYEIKPYAAGTTSLLIPFEKIKTIARPNTILRQD